MPAALAATEEQRAPAGADRLEGTVLERAELDRREAGRMELDRMEAARMEVDRLETDRMEAGRMEMDRLEADHQDRVAMAVRAAEVSTPVVCTRANRATAHPLAPRWTSIATGPELATTVKT